MNYGWRKASYSNSQGACVEAASFRKSSYSVHFADACVETGTGPGVVGVRDTKNQGLGPVLEFSPGAWNSFLAGLK